MRCASRPLQLPFLGSNVTVVPGDVTDPDLADKLCGEGRTEDVGPISRWDQSENETSPAIPGLIPSGDGTYVSGPLPPMAEFWHIAGLTTFNESKRAQLEAVNIHGTAHALELARRLECQRFFHISTAYVAGICDGPVMEDGLLPNPVFRNPYEETKYHGEKLVRESDLPWIVIRPSIIMGHSETGAVDSDKMVYGVVRCYHTLAKWVRRDFRDYGDIPETLHYFARGNPSVTKNCICVDDCVRLMLTARQRAKAGTTYHACCQEPVTLGEMHDITIGMLGIDFLTMTPSYEHKGDSKQAFMERGTRVYEPYMLLHDPIFSLGNALRMNGWRPRPLDTERLRMLIRQYLCRRDELERREVNGWDTSLDIERLPDIQRWGDSSNAHLLCLSRQLHAFRVPGVPGFLAYAVVDKTVMLVSDPITSEPEALLRAFLEWRKGHDLDFMGLQLRHGTAVLLRSMGLAINKLGIETHIDLLRFDPEMRGREYTNLRKRTNIARRFGLRCYEQPVHLANPKEVMDLTEQWRDRKKNSGELRLLLREIFLVPEPGVRYCFLRHPERLLGYIFWMPMHREGRIIGYDAGIERHALNDAGLPARFNVMRHIAFEFARTTKAEGCDVLALGMSPLFEVEKSEFNDNLDLMRLFQQLYDESELYAFQGIARHKRSYPCRIEEPAYIATEPETTSKNILDAFRGVGFFD